MAFICIRLTLRACLKILSRAGSLKAGQTSEHQTGHSGIDHRFTGGWQPFVVLAQTPIASQPAERPFHDPASRENLEALDIVVSFDNLQDPMADVFDPSHQWASIAAIRPNQTQAGELVFGLSEIEQGIGPGATSRLRMFLGKSMKAGLKPSESAKQWIPFKKYALVKLEHWDEPKSHRIAVFYLARDGAAAVLHFPTNNYGRVVGFNVDRLGEELIELGFRLAGKSQEPRVDLRIYNDQAFFDTLFDLVMQTVNDLETTLQE